MVFLKITAYTDENFSKKAGSAPFEASINPENFTIDRSIKFDADESTNVKGTTRKFKSYEPETLKFTLFLDGTGVVERNANKSIDDKIKALWNVVYKFEGTIHKPYYLLVEWKEIYFKCHCEKFTTEYQLFNNDGTALRAKVDLTFVEFVKPGSSGKNNYNGHQSSPDLTHIKTVREGDNLPIMVQDVYGKTDYYIEVARRNGITNFRSLEIGNQILFPPIEK